MNLSATACKIQYICTTLKIFLGRESKAFIMFSKDPKKRLQLFDMEKIPSVYRIAISTGEGRWCEWVMWMRYWALGSGRNCGISHVFAPTKHRSCFSAPNHCSVWGTGPSVSLIFFQKKPEIWMFTWSLPNFKCLQYFEVKQIIIIWYKWLVCWFGPLAAGPKRSQAFQNIIIFSLGL